MDVQADETELRHDPSPTVMIERPVTDSQGQLFRDADPTYAETDQLPAVKRHAGRTGSSRFLRVLVIIVAIAVLAAGAALGLVKAGVIDKNGTNNPPAAQAPQHHGSAPSTAPLVTQVSTGSGTATYRVDIAAYAVTVTTTTGRSWVSIGGVGQRAAFASILNPNSSQKEILLGPSTVNVGAGGTKVTVASGKRSETLTPPSAPFSYQFIVKH
jgi:hypothetical protein